MSVHINFDQSENRCYTNLDFVSGTVSLILPNDATISAVTVKLEGESRTRLAGPKFPNNDRSEKKRTELELHKVGEKNHRCAGACAYTQGNSFCTKSSPSFLHRSCGREVAAAPILCWLVNTSILSDSRLEPTSNVRYPFNDAG